MQVSPCYIALLEMFMAALEVSTLQFLGAGSGPASSRPEGAYRAK